jgi:type III secretion protein U
MAEDRPFPPSPRRLALARRAGLTTTSPLLVGGVACAALLVTVLALARAAMLRLAADLAAACAGRARVAPAAVVTIVLDLALPLLAAAAIIAIVAQVVQARAVWLPRRTLPDAPAPPPQRVRRAAFELASAAVIAAVAFGWLWWAAPRLAALPVAPLAAAALVASALAAFAIAWIAIGAIDALVRHAALTAALRMTAAEKREDDRLAGADPRWKRRRRSDSTPSLAGATLLVLGDDIAVAIAWDPRRRPVPERLARGRRARATQLLGLARRDRIPVQRDEPLARALLDGDGPVPREHWPRLAEIVASARSAAP